MGFGTEKTVRTFKAGVHTFEIEEAVVKQNPVKGSAYLNLKKCICIDKKGDDVGRTVENQLLMFLFGLNFDPNVKNDGAVIRDTFYFLVSVCGLDYLDFDADEMEKSEVFQKAYDLLLENADTISDDLVGKVFKARTVNGTDMEGAECSNFAKGSFSAIVEKKGASKDEGDASKGKVDKNEATVDADDDLVDDF